MSHMSTVITQIKSTEDIRACLEELGYTIVETKNVRGYQGSTVKVEFAVEPKRGGYQIGFRKDKHGNYEIVADWWGVHGISEREFLSQLVRLHAERKVRKYAKRKGYRVIEEKAPEGVHVQLLLVRRGYLK